MKNMTETLGFHEFNSLWHAPLCYSISINRSQERSDFTNSIIHSEILF
jgi:hypothetical protein